MELCCCVFSVSFVDLIVALLWKPSVFGYVRVFTCYVSSVGKVCKQLVRSSTKCVFVGADSS